MEQEDTQREWDEQEKRCKKVEKQRKKEERRQEKKERRCERHQYKCVRDPRSHTEDHGSLHGASSPTSSHDHPPNAAQEQSGGTLWTAEGAHSLQEGKKTSRQASWSSMSSTSQIASSRSEEIMQQADQRMPPKPKRKKRKQSIAGPVVMDDSFDEDGEMSMDIDSTCPGSCFSL